MYYGKQSIKLDSNILSYVWLNIFNQIITITATIGFIIQITYTKMQRTKANIKQIILLLCVLILAHSQFKSAPYAEWAHSHLVWINANQQNQAKMYKLVQDYKDNGIPVGAINIDSVWSACLNNFEVDRKKFPHLETLIKDMHAQNVRVILWATPIINQQCPQYKVGVQKKYFLNNGKTVKWWHGHGAFIDFFNPQAKKWFQSLMDRVLDMGVDGWKCDGADPLIYLLKPFPYSPGKKRFITFPQYANQYYGTFYNYTKTKNPNGLIMSRPVDSYQGKFYSNYSPKYVMFMGWVGDQHNDVQGFKYAMANVIHSASRGYLNFGFDIGGYKTSGESKKYLFLRWVQIGALLPFMENGGGGKHQPWLFDQQTVQIYRKFALLHYDLKEFFLTAGTEAYAKKVSVLQPIHKDKKKIEFQDNYNLGYVLWDSFLVSPIFQESGYVQVVFPKGYKWVYFFDRSRVYEGGATRSMGIKLDQAALFMRSNSIIPIKGQLWCVMLEEGKHSKTVIGGDYSDQVTIDYTGQRFAIKVQRFYENEDVKSQRKQQEITVRLIGFNQNLIENSSNSKNVRTESSSTQKSISVPLNHSFVFQLIPSSEQGVKI